MKRVVGGLLAFVLLAAGAATRAQDANITAPAADLERTLTTEPFAIVAAEISRPKAKGDFTLRADVSFSGHDPIRVKLRKAEPGAETFNNTPRFDIAAYQLQKLFLDPPEYVVPPTALRMVPLAEFHKYSSDVKPTFPGADEVLAVMQYWLQDIKVIADVLKPDLFASDAVYARHIGQLNILTYLIQHADSNVGNFLIGRAEAGPRVFSIDNGVAFGAGESNRGKLWQDLRVNRLPADAIERLRKLKRQDWDAALGVLVEWRLQDGHYVAEPPGPNLGVFHGVRRRGDIVQMGLTRPEIDAVAKQAERLLRMVDRGEITTF